MFRVLTRSNVLDGSYRPNGMALGTGARKECLGPDHHPSHGAISTDDPVFHIEETVTFAPVRACDCTEDAFPILGMDHLRHVFNNAVLAHQHDRLIGSPTVDPAVLRGPIHPVGQMVMFEDADVREADHLPQLLFGLSRGTRR
jgi:hypothetical protein